jgi:hypothetical protein
MRKILGSATLWRTVTILLSFAAADFAQADGLQAGLWRVLTTPEINGAAAPPRESRRCLSPEAVGDLERTFSPVARTTNSECERVVYESTPQRLKWRLQCTGQLDMDVAGEFVFERPDRYTATIVASSSMLGKLLQSVRTTIEAQRVGDCP